MNDFYCRNCKYRSKNLTKEMEWTHGTCHVMEYLRNKIMGKKHGWYNERSERNKCIFQGVIFGIGTDND